jgi:general secretion pathway protein L
MNLLRLYCPLLEIPAQCQWALVGDDGKSSVGSSSLKSLPRKANRIQLVIPASEVMITRTRLPAAARRATGSVLNFAVEDQTATEPDANQVSWLGTVDEGDVLAIVSRRGLDRWRTLLAEAGIRGYEVCSEMLLLPGTPGAWSIAWNGFEGFVRTGKLEAAATDSGDRASPPLSLRLMLETAKANGKTPNSLTLYTLAEDALPDVQAWQAILGLPIRHAGSWDWRNAPITEGVSLAQEAPRWGGMTAIAPRLRVAAWIAGIALVLHAVALAADWTHLANEQRSLRRQMDERFRTTFPDAVAVVDPLLQMRRKVAETRHAVGQPDIGDFLPMVEKVSAEIRDLPQGSMRIVSYESGRLTIEMLAADTAYVDRVVTQLRQSGFNVDRSASSAGPGRAVLSVRTL